MLLVKRILLNCSDESRKLASASVAKGDAIERIIREFSFPQINVANITEEEDIHYRMLDFNLGILHNLIRHANEDRSHIRKHDGINKILPYVKSDHPMIKTGALFVIAYCVNEDENNKIMADYGVIAFILNILQLAVESPKHVGMANNSDFSAEELVDALNKLASNEDNKKVIVEEGILPMLTTLLNDENSSASEHLNSVNCLWSLAFHEDNKNKIIQEPGLIDSIKSLRMIDDDLKKAVQGLMFVLGLDQPAGTRNQMTCKQNKHIMLSYNWDVQAVILQLKEYLSSQDYNIWMDVDKIHDSILAAMAEAVENSALIVVAMTESYKHSLPCRTEAEYAYKRRVPILPLLLQHGYEADGWLGAMVGTRLYVDLSSENFQNRFPDVLNEIRSLSTMEKERQAAVYPLSTAPPTASLSPESVQSSVTPVRGTGVALARTVLPCEAWSVSEVQSWCCRIGITELQRYDGRALSQLCKLLVRSPDEYYRLLREDLHLDSTNRLMLTDSLENFMR